MVISRLMLFSVNSVINMVIQFCFEDDVEDDDAFSANRNNVPVLAMLMIHLLFD